VDGIYIDIDILRTEGEGTAHVALAETFSHLPGHPPI
jgi:hypothetical protein